ncbi:hypothetical protein A0257_01615 [Hymenobacter psoromatis]|nr:hypothetical protein A0257_01615 [Hymenobacter psoromatis]
MDFPLSRTGLRLKYLSATIPLAIILVAFGMAPWQAVLICLALWILISRGYAGKEISAEFTQVRDYYDLLGWRFGSWQKLPTIVGVTLKKFSVLQSRMPAAMSWGSWQNSTGRLEEIVIILSVQHSRQGIIIGRTSVETLDQTTEAANRLAAHFGVPVNLYLQG